MDPSLLNKRGIYELRKKITHISQPSPELVEAIEKADIEGVIKTLQSGVSPNFKTCLKRLRYPIHEAVFIGSIEIVKVLLNFGADIECTDTMGMTPLFYAIERSNIEMAKFLIDNGAIVEAKDLQLSTPLYQAVFCSTLEMIKMLHSNGANVVTYNFLNRSPYIKASYQNKYDILEYLMSIDTTLKDFSDERGRTPLMAACWGQKGGRKGKKMHGVDVSDSPESIKILIKHGSDIYKKDKDGNNAIHISASTCALDSLKVWREYFGNEIFKVKNDDGLDCMLAATEFGHCEVIEYLVDDCQFSPVVFNTTSGEFIQCRAVKNKGFHIVTYLIKKYTENEEKFVELLQTHPEICAEYIKSQLQYVFKHKKTGWQRFVTKGWLEQSIIFEGRSYIWDAICKNENVTKLIIDFIEKCQKYDAMSIIEHQSLQIGEDKIKAFINQNFNELINQINPNFDSEIFQNYSSFKIFITKYCDKDLLRDYRDHKKRNLLSLCIPKSIGEIIELMLKTFIAKDKNESEIQEILDELDKKDLDNMNYIDYAITNRKTMVPEYLKSIHKTQKMPEIRIIEFSFTPKSEEILKKEKQFIKELTEKLTLIEKSQTACYEFDGEIQKLESLISNIKLVDENTKYFSFNSLKDKSLKYIDTEDHQKKTMEILKNQKIVGIDVEFSDGNYNPVNSQPTNFIEENDKTTEKTKPSSSIACSVQISTLDDNYFIDCLATHHIFRKYFKDFLENVNIIKVLHGSDTDVKVLYENYGIILTNVFDTAKCWSVLHKSKNLPGLGRISKEMFSVDIDKTFQCAEWRIRPIPEGMLEYAITDSYLMIPLFWHFINNIDCEALKNKPWLKSRNDLLWKTYHKSNGFSRHMKFSNNYFSV